MNNPMNSSQFSKRTTDDFPIIRACKQNNIDFVRLQDFLNEYGWFLSDGTASRAFQLHASRAFQEIETTAQALNEGQNCFNQFVKDFYEEVNSYQVSHSDFVE
jgi:hypothetical protein